MRKPVVIRNNNTDEEIQRELNALLEEFSDTLSMEQNERSTQLRNDADIFEYRLYSAGAIAGATVALSFLFARDSGSVESFGFVVHRLSNRLRAAHLAACHPGKWAFPKKTANVLHKIKNALERRN